MDSELIEIRTGRDEAVVDLGSEITAFLRSTGASDGLLHVWVPHATAGLAVLETGAGSPGHGRDHLLPALISPSLSVPVLDGRPALGTWQSVCLVDTNRDNPVRSVRLSFVPG